MKNYIATRKRAYWVTETMHIEAESAEEAEYTFFNEFCAELEVENVFYLGSEQYAENIEIVEAEIKDTFERLSEEEGLR